MKDGFAPAKTQHAFVSLLQYFSNLDPRMKEPKILKF